MEYVTSPGEISIRQQHLLIHILGRFISSRDLEKHSWKSYSIDTILATALALLMTGCIFALHLYPKIPDISLLYLMAVLALAITRGRYAAVITCIAAFLSFDYFLVPPLFTFSISKFEEWLALFVFLTTAVITGQLASALWQRAELARRRESEMRALYELVRTTAAEEDFDKKLMLVVEGIVENFASSGVRDCAILLPDTRTELTVQASAIESPEQIMAHGEELATASLALTCQEVIDIRNALVIPEILQAACHGKSSYVRMIPLVIGQKAAGVVRLLLEDHPQGFGGEQSLGLEREHQHPHATFFWSFLDQTASIIERERLRRETLQVEVLQRTDELRSALLSSVSHDLRTPLSSIKAAASSLLQEDIQWDEEARSSFASTIEREADRLNRLVGNLLDMSRIEGGALKPEKEWFPFDELIHDVVDRMKDTLQHRQVHTSIPDDLPPVRVDYLQMDQVLTNLLENALRYTPAESPIDIVAEVKKNTLLITIADRGPGIPRQDQERIFDKFYRVLMHYPPDEEMLLSMPGKRKRPRQIDATHKSSQGSGLGLAVCRGLIEAHDGHIWVEQREGGGALFRFSLPIAPFTDL